MRRAAVSRTMRFFTFVLLVIIETACRCKRDLVETLAWMDNTYNPHEGVSGAYRHGRTGWYSHNLNEKGGEHLETESTETFIHDGCKLTLRVLDNPYTPAHSELYGTTVVNFNLRDINPQSITVNTYSHFGGLWCENYTLEDQQLLELNCDHSEIVFSTRNEAPRVDEETHTIFPKLQGSDHESKGKSKSARAALEVDDIKYAVRFAKALRHAVALCGGRQEAF